MQQKHKKKGHARPIVPVHAAAAPAKAGAAAPAGGKQASHPAKHKQAGLAQQKPQQQQHKQQQQQQGKPAGLGKRKQPEGMQQQPAKKQNKQQQQQQRQQAQQGVAPNEGMQHQQQQQHQPKERQDPKQQQQKKSSQGKQAQQAPQQQQYFKKRSSKPKHKQDREAAAAGDAAAASTMQANSTATGAPAADDTAGPTAVAAAAAKPLQLKQPAAIGSNWQALKQQLVAEQAAKPKRPRKGTGQAPGAAAGGSSSSSSSAGKKQIGSIGHNKDATPIVAMDCEMVGVGPGGERDSLARVSIVNAAGNVLLDSFVAQKEPVTDYRTWVSGVTAKELQGAPELAEVQKAAAELLQGRTLVGHGLSKDLRVLMLSHPRKAIRDTAKYPPFMFSKGGKRKPRALRHLALQELGLVIQEGEHSSVDDARAALYLYQKHAATWERALKTPSGLKQLPTANRPAAKKKRVESYRLRDVQDDPMADL